MPDTMVAEGATTTEVASAPFAEAAGATVPRMWAEGLWSGGFWQPIREIEG